MGTKFVLSMLMVFVLMDLSSASLRDAIPRRTKQSIQKCREMYGVSARDDWLTIKSAYGKGLREAMKAKRMGYAHEVPNTNQLTSCFQVLFTEEKKNPLSILNNQEYKDQREKENIEADMDGNVQYVDAEDMASPEELGEAPEVVDTKEADAKEVESDTVDEKETGKDEL